MHNYLDDILLVWMGGRLFVIMSILVDFIKEVFDVLYGWYCGWVNVIASFWVDDERLSDFLDVIDVGNNEWLRWEHPPESLNVRQNLDILLAT